MRQVWNSIRQFWNRGESASPEREADLPGRSLIDLAGSSRWKECDRLSLVESSTGLEAARSISQGVAEIATLPQIVYYQSLSHLREQWERLDQRDFVSDLTVILVLDRRASGHLPSMIRRIHRAQQLLIVSSSGRLPGTISKGDLALQASRLGWSSIGFHWRLEEALVDAANLGNDPERCVVFWPCGVNSDEFGEPEGYPSAESWRLM